MRERSVSHPPLHTDGEKTETHEGQHEGQDHEEHEEEGLQANEEIVARRIGAAGGCEGKKVRCVASFSDTRRSSFQWGCGDNSILHNERRSLCACVGGLCPREIGGPLTSDDGTLYTKLK